MGAVGVHLTEEQKQQVRERLAAGDRTREISRAYGIHRDTINKMRRAMLAEAGMSDGERESVKAAKIAASSYGGGWIITDKDGEIIRRSTRVKAPEGEDAVAAMEAALDAILDQLAERSPVFPAPPKPKGDHLLVVSPADVHMGKLAEVMETGDRYDLEVAERRTKEGVLSLLEAAERHGLACITINTGNDSLHIDSPKRTTTSGTPQDTDGQLFTMWDCMFWTWVWVIETAATYAPVHVVFDPSNHPWVADWTLNRALGAHFRNDERVTLDVSMSSIRHRKYQVFGDSLIGFTHGDGAKEKDLPILMQHECREWWGKTRRGYWIVKHIHHKQDRLLGLAPYEAEKDHPGVTVIRSGDRAPDRNVAVEVVRSPSSSDGWHDRNGYVGAIKAVEAFLFHETRGQVARFTHPFY